MGPLEQVVNGQAAQPSPFVELGSSGLKRFGGNTFGSGYGYVNEEFLRELQGTKGVAAYREMAENHPVIGAMLFAIKMMCRQVKWDVQPSASNDPKAIVVRDFVASCLDDMSCTFDDVLVEILTMLTYGWAYCETVYKQRRGPNDDPAQRSKFNDGKFGWRKIALRAQESLQGWQFDENGGLRAMVQWAPPDYQRRTIPVERALLFRPEFSKQNPEGRSPLRNAYTSYYFSKHFMRIWGIGVERDLNGIPVAWVPPEMLGANATAEMVTNLTAIKKIVTQIRNDEQSGLVFPLSYNDQGLKKYDLTLLSTQGRRNFDLVAAMNYLDSKIAQTVLADMILLGHGESGSWALADSKVELFSTSVDAWLDSVCSVFNRYGIPRLTMLNAFPQELNPVMTHSKVAKVSLEKLGIFIGALTGAGAQLFPNQQLEGHLLREAGLPEQQDETTEVGKAAVSNSGAEEIYKAVADFRQALGDAA